MVSDEQIRSEDCLLPLFYPLSFKTRSRSSHQRSSIKRCSQNFRKIHMKTPVSESLYLIGVSGTGVCEFWGILKNSFSTEHLRTIASEARLVHFIPLVSFCTLKTFLFSTASFVHPFNIGKIICPDYKNINNKNILPF